MGLSGPKNRRKLAHDPNNTRWSRNETTFGHRILRAQGWEPGNVLGAKDARHARLHSAASSAPIKVVLKDDTLGLGAKVRQKQSTECTGLDGFKDLLGRLNGKSDDTIEKERKLRSDIRTSLYVERRYGPMRFVGGGLLVGDQMQALASTDPATSDRESTQNSTSESVEEGREPSKKAEREKKSKKRKAEEAEPADGSGGSQEKKRKKRAKDEGAQDDSTEDFKQKDSSKERKTSKKWKESSKGEGDSSKSKQKDKKRKSSKDKASAASGSDAEDKETSASGDSTSKGKQDKKKRKKEKKEKKLAKLIGEATPTETATPSNISPRESESSTPVGTGTFTPQVVGNRHHITQPRVTLMRSGRRPDSSLALHVNDPANMIEPGLHIIFDNARDRPGHCAAEIDIVAVHGLNFRNNPNHARDTWKAADSLWLRDFLPDKLAKPARVILFSYNSSPAIDATAIKALVEATLDPAYKPIVEATKLLVFFATPHRGGKYASLGDIAARIVRAGLRKPSNKLLDALKKKSDSATKRFEQSRHLYERCLIVNFFEGQPYGKLGIIVDKDSATLGLPGSREKQVATHADHSSICKFDSVDTSACKLVLGTIATEIARALEIESNNVHWLVPRSVNPMFTGRRDIVEKIKKAIIPSTYHAQKRFVLTGLGGQGKSEVCLKVTDELREEFWGVFWVDVSSQSTAKAGFSTIAKMLGSRETESDDPQRLLSNVDPKRHWLLILDNADDPDVDYQQYYPSSTRGTVLITSRNPECRIHATVGYEELGSLDKGDCLRLLLQPIGLSPESQAVTSAAERVIHILGSHTLAIIQAGSYIAQGGCSLSDYPVVFQRQCERLLKFNLTQAQSRYRNVYATLEASAQTLDILESESARDALCLLQVLSQFHYENVPLDLLQDAWDGAQEARNNPEDDEAIENLTTWHASQLPEFLESDSHIWDPFRMSQAVNRLESLALVQKSNIKGRWTRSPDIINTNGGRIEII
ncbi:hypothetical protein DL765_003834 [Monosporascus sp. GIB2]|nr:hypothetical protein DL765_003834 [Monosporascus sp. GIB2]